MSDLVTLPGTGAVVLTDEVTHGTFGTGQAQVIKVIDGTANGTTGWIVESDGAADVVQIGKTSATLTNVTSAASNTSLLSSNAAARARMCFNDSTATLYLKFGTTASTTSFTVAIPPGGYYEFPQPLYKGAVDGIWSAANGAARMTEM